MELIISNIEKNFDAKQVLRGASFTFEKGRIYGLLGRNGAGKTTLFNCVSRELEYEKGSVVLRENGQEVPMDYEKIGYAFSMPILPEFLTGYEFIKFFLDINQKKIKDRETVEEYADMVALARTDLDCLLKGYSHGMKNKMQMLCLLISRPPVLLLDEPLTSLDVVAAHEMKEMLLEMKKDHIIILSTHILQLAKDLCDEIVLLHQGVLTGMGESDYQSEDFEDKIMALLSQGDSPETGEQDTEIGLDTVQNSVGNGGQQPGSIYQEEQGDEDPYDY